MTPDKFRQLALEHFAASEGSHMGHADFRVGAMSNGAGGRAKKSKPGKVFASLPPVLKDEQETLLGMVRLSPEQQREFIAQRPEVFFPAQGAWGKQGCTYVRLKRADVSTVRRALRCAWLNVAPPGVIKTSEEL